MIKKLDSMVIAAAFTESLADGRLGSEILGATNDAQRRSPCSRSVIEASTTSFRNR